MEINIAVIGLGNLGKRHLESIMHSTREWNVYGIDINADTLKELDEQYNTKQQIKFKGGDTIDFLPSHLDVVIIATSSAVRRKIFEELLQHSRMDYIIFEKVLFQRIEDYYYVNECLKKYKIQAWVNCPRREYDIYRELYKEVICNQLFEMHIYGGEWGMACNAVHMLDLIEWYGGAPCKIENLALSDNIAESKRAGYKEVYGCISGACGRCSNWSISSYSNSSLPLTIEIIGDYFTCKIIAEKKRMIMAYKDKQWEEEIREYIPTYQSQLTQKVVEKILDTSECNLPVFAESMNTHLRIVEPLIKFFEKRGMEEGLCPIT